MTTTRGAGELGAAAVGAEAPDNVPPNAPDHAKASASAGSAAASLPRTRARRWAAPSFVAFGSAALTCLASCFASHQ